MKHKKLKEIFSMSQLILTIFTIFLFIAFLVNRDLWIFLELILGIDLFIMAVNNQLFYKKNIVTIIYILIGIFLIALDVVGIMRS